MDYNNKNRQVYRIKGNKTLSGEITPQGAKNEALQVICATLLTPEEVIIHNVPHILDVLRLIELLEGLGMKAKRIGEHSWSFQADDIHPEYMQSREYHQKARALRGSMMVVGPVLARFGKAYSPRPGGDKIGRRRVDTHFNGLQKLGAKIGENAATHIPFLEASKLKGTYILLDEASVTGTANIVMAATLAEGTTTLFNAACEPYVVQLCKMLNRMGARISGIGSNLLTIEGVEHLGSTTHTLMPDMIEVGSFIGLAAMTQSQLIIKNTNYRSLGIIPEIFRRLGVETFPDNNDIIVPTKEHYEIESFCDGSIMSISDAPWPGFTPDLISIALVVSTQAKGSVLIHQKMFESRLFFVDSLIEMGARIILCDPHRATVIGLDWKYRLRGICMSSPDIRAGVALLIAALSAKGESIIENIEQIDRGYENLDARLQVLGADIERI
ncbi:MAG TPA: UDP-N-acetylglucosamine 1-carboxyvinyltransferase [Bacteroidales bacterium]|jgi:UDP-N-acetylglucosamine 1-carboxyvinyltransferase|nr:UDP-N-acetylglucosamine 1-carboxyvinyltransferase [Bacteroidales bacterium]MDI9573019.1 UDP-N-acetylglucosamine 1-carboxyvinyltransferase [Bacteroidota bacterium]OQC60047.1 MAG: UDP-N-acetylglucosamine 1-carboxyvinyltransferase [Bacteroidetes bacterium ADurb.Bin012]MBP9511751.1 UDP-N-acetylglucosamine 1-carboxyvinyltransferase [Bacteroidales bacterium]MBP9588514.1 UDP-N-acetylglucosamine 1-carboxyvinyltransferase [Bacteroidales bacterium]